jgi:hypothetical protein
MTLFQEGSTVSNNKLIFPVALKTTIIRRLLCLLYMTSLIRETSTKNVLDQCREKTDPENILQQFFYLYFITLQILI